MDQQSRKSSCGTCYVLCEFLTLIPVGQVAVKAIRITDARDEQALKQAKNVRWFQLSFGMCIECRS
jgi:hypothetical protein